MTFKEALICGAVLITYCGVILMSMVFVHAEIECSEPTTDIEITICTGDIDPADPYIDPLSDEIPYIYDRSE